QYVLSKKDQWSGMHDRGTGGMMEGDMAAGNIPVSNFRDGEFSDISKITAQAVRDTIMVKMEGCFACPLRCKKVVKVDEPYSVDPAYGGPEYETLAAIGCNCGVGDLKAIAKGNELCNAYSLDTISTGDVIAFAMECFENGLLSTKDTGGIELKFGNAEAMLKLTQMIGERKGIGDLLAEGSFRAAQKIGKNAEKYAMHVKGQELPLHDPRGKVSLALAYATSPTGADHLEAEHDFDFVEGSPSLPNALCLGISEPLSNFDLGEKKVRLYTYLQHLWSSYNALGLCNFVAGPGGALPIPKIVQSLNAVTGWDVSLWELMKAGERATTIARIFNIKEGFSRKEDILPARFYQEALNEGELKCGKLDYEEFEKALTTYYHMMGWNNKGIPTKEKIYELDIGWTKKYLK
ncbi:MAG: aldehyde ferredoxin oxidoreductase C-terminal domain-containing protein, partial [Candidatus Asgardarchaeum sp.]